MTICKLEKMPYAQAHVEISENGVALFSYTTLAAHIDPEGWLSVRCLCSQTRRRRMRDEVVHISKDIVVTLELGGTRAELEEMLNKI